MKEPVPTNHPEDAPLAERITEVYWQRVRDTGLGEDQSRAMRGELRERVGKCIEYFQEESPGEVEELKRMLDRYDRLRKAAGLSRALLEVPSRLLPGVLGHIQAVAEVILGLIPALFGLVTGFLPYMVTRLYAGRSPQPERSSRLLVAIVSFSLFYGGLIGLVGWQFSKQATILLSVLVVPTGLFAIAYVKRIRTIVAHLGDRTASWFKLEAVARVRKAQDEVVGELDRMRNRYRQDALGWDPLPPHSHRRTTRGALARVVVIILVTIGTGMFIKGSMDKPVEGLPLGPSPWQKTRASDPIAAERELLRDAEGVLLAARQLDRVEKQMSHLREGFSNGERSFLNQRDQDEMRALQVAYLDLRSTLLKTVWLYRGANTETVSEKTDPLEVRAFLTAYAAAAVLVEKAWLIYDSFRNAPETREQLDRGDLAWGIPPGTFSNISASLTNQSVMAELRSATRRFESDMMARRFPVEAPWDGLAERAKLSRPSLEEAFDGIGKRILDRAFREMEKELSDSASEVKPVVSMTVSRFRFKERPPHRGLISPEQLEDLRPLLKPGDILIQRRNWYISNCVLPGFWPHTALYLGSREQLEELGIGSDPRAAPHLEDLEGQDQRGNNFAIIEAVGEGVIFTSFEKSVGESDAVVALRPILSDEDLRGAILRALSHRGKEYDFDFDFETTDRLVCTELIFRTYDPVLEIPGMRLIAGKPRIAASDYVRMWAEGYQSGSPQLELVRFFDFDEPNGVAVLSDAETLKETLQRSRFTFMKEQPEFLEVLKGQ